MVALYVFYIVLALLGCAVLLAVVRNRELPANVASGFACGVEFWSFLENAAQLSDAPLFRWLKRYVRRRMRKEAGDV